MTAQRAFHFLMLGLSLCLLSSQFTTVVERCDNGAIQKADRSMTTMRFWKAVAKDMMQGP